MAHCWNTVLVLGLVLANIGHEAIEALVSVLYWAQHRDSMSYHVFAHTSADGQLVNHVDLLVPMRALVACFLAHIWWRYASFFDADVSTTSLAPLFAMSDCAHSLLPIPSQVLPLLACAVGECFSVVL